ncbi:MAG TPA: ABC transporter ATP-binding protein [Chloroflexi bacterium]|nr:ABC transporter ATP-binding protein [Chloroflexota bacterium]
MPLLEVRHLHKSYPDGWTLTDVSFAVESGDLACLLGPSGCGKTTLLRLIAGLETPDHGQVLVLGQDVTRVPPHRRGFGLMFQEYALFPHQDVFGNVAFGLWMQNWERDAVAKRVAQVLEWVSLTGFEHRDVNQLSGGERQRVALARSLAPEPRLLMLDEPLGALDRTLRERLLEELPVILRRAGVTAITVTHDQEEAFALADQVILMHAGRTVQRGRPEEVYRQPASTWVARFLGLTNLLDADIVAGGWVETPIGRLQVETEGTGVRNSSRKMQVLIRPEAGRPGAGGPNPLHGTVTDRSFRGEYYRIEIRHASGVTITLNAPANIPLPAPGEPITLSLDPQALALLPTEERQL